MNQKRFIYIGRRVSAGSKALKSALVDFENPQSDAYLTFKGKTTVPYPIGTVISFEVSDEGHMGTAWGVSAKPEGLYHDENMVAAWELAAATASAKERQEKMLAKEGGVLNRRVEALAKAIDNLSPWDRPAARVYVVAKLMGMK